MAETTEATAPNHGEVFTRRWVVDLILDLAKYHPDQDLTQIVLMEPCIGSGAFVTVACERLAQSKNRHRPDASWMDLSGCVRGWDIQPEHVATCRHSITSLLTHQGCPQVDAERLVAQWFETGDFLLKTPEGVRADVVVGNPPYVRIEDIAPSTLAAYRKACETMTGRADIFVGFYEKGLDLLAEEGRLVYICADRWMLNDYGRKLRAKIVDGPFSMDAVLSMHDVNAFETAVSAYPAITALRRGAQGTVLVAECGSDLDEQGARKLASPELDTAEYPVVSGATASILPDWHNTKASWPVGSPHVIAWLERLEETLPTLEESSASTRIGIGVATGADAVYVRDMDDLPYVEADRLLPLVVSADVANGVFSWTGQHLVSPWDANGLVDLKDYPRLATYYEEHAPRLLGRNVAKKRPRTWFRTIDRVNLGLLKSEMLVLGDMRKHARPVRVKAGYYPHHNLYYITSDEWDLDVLGGLIMSQHVEAQVAAYCVKMRGGTLRFQAQYLRRVRVPRPDAIPHEAATALADAFRDQDAAAATRAAEAAFSSAGVPIPG